MKEQDTCACGDVGDEHANYGEGACEVDGCPCVAFEWDGEDGDDE